jgi:ferric-dicitrate binding protein FerR (iron transport regulator)
MVKCADCGYLGVRHPETLELVGPSHQQRETGALTGTLRGQMFLDEQPICAVGAFDLWRETAAQPDGALRVMQKPRDCLKSTEWIPGLSPKEHIDMNMLERSERRDTRNFWIQCALMVAAFAAAVAAWWSATHPTAIPIPQPPAAISPTNPANE